MLQTRTIQVALGERAYPIVIGRGLLSGGFDLAAHVAGTDCLVVSNVTVAPLYLESLREGLAGKQVESIALPDGEAHKTLATMQSILDRLVAMGANRDTTVRCPRRCWHRSIRRSEARRASITRRARTS
jgi:3-dehydroquinate synthase